LVKARQTNELGKEEEGKPDSSLRQGKGRQRKAEEGKRQGRADENTGSKRMTIANGMTILNY
jgi:hypothetical protein